MRKFKPHKNKVRIPKDKSEFEEVSRVLIGFPNTEGLSEEEARSAILDYWNYEGKDREAFRTLVESVVQINTFISRIFLKLVELQFKVPISVE